MPKKQYIVPGHKIGGKCYESGEIPYKIGAGEGVILLDYKIKAFDFDPIPDSNMERLGKSAEFNEERHEKISEPSEKDSASQTVSETTSYEVSNSTLGTPMDEFKEFQ